MTSDLFDHERSLSGVDICYGDRGSFLGEFEGAGASDSECATRDDRRFPLQSVHRFSLD
jgi:hypothetical protein